MRAGLILLGALSLAEAANNTYFNASHCNAGGFAMKEGVVCNSTASNLMVQTQDGHYVASVFMGAKDAKASLGMKLGFKTEWWVGSASVCVTSKAPAKDPHFRQACGGAVVAKAGSTPVLMADGWRIKNAALPDLDPFHDVKSSNGMALNSTATFGSGFPFYIDWESKDQMPHPNWQDIKVTDATNMMGTDTSFVALTHKDVKTGYAPIATIEKKGADGVVPSPFSWAAGTDNELGMTIECDRKNNEQRYVNVVMQGAAVSYYLKGAARKPEPKPEPTPTPAPKPVVKPTPTPTPKPKPPAPKPKPHTLTPTPVPKRKPTPKPTPTPAPGDRAAETAAAFSWVSSVEMDKKTRPEGYGPAALRLSSPGAAAMAADEDGARVSVQMPALRILKDISTFTYTWMFEKDDDKTERDLLRVSMQVMIDCTMDPSKMTDDDWYVAEAMTTTKEMGKWETSNFVSIATVRKYKDAPSKDDAKFGEFALRKGSACVQAFGFGSQWIMPGLHIDVVTPTGSKGTATAQFAGFEYNGNKLATSLADDKGAMMTGALDADKLYLTGMKSTTVRTECVTEWVNVEISQRCDSGVMCNTFNKHEVLATLSGLPESAQPLDVEFNCGPCVPVDADATPVPKPEMTPTPTHKKDEKPKHMTVTPTPKKEEDEVETRARRAGYVAEAVESSVVVIRVRNTAAAELLANHIRAGVKSDYLPQWSEFNFTNQDGKVLALDIAPPKDFAEAPWVKAGYVFSACRERDSCPCGNTTCSCDACPVGTESRIAIAFPECGFPKVKTQKEATDCLTKAAQGCLLDVDGDDRHSAEAGKWTMRPASVEKSHWTRHQSEVYIEEGLLVCDDWDSGNGSGLWWILLVVGVVVVVAGGVAGFLYLRNSSDEEEIRFSQPLTTAKGYESVTPGLAG